MPAMKREAGAEKEGKLCQTAFEKEGNGKDGREKPEEPLPEIIMGIFKISRG